MHAATTCYTRYHVRPDHRSGTVRYLPVADPEIELAMLFNRRGFLLTRSIQARSTRCSPTSGKRSTTRFGHDPAITLCLDEAHVF